MPSEDNKPKEIMVVRDALADPRFAESALVLGWPHIRFYAGAPLLVGGSDGVKRAIGTLCVIDTAVEHGGTGARTEQAFGVREKQILLDFGALLTGAIEAREQAKRALSAAKTDYISCTAHDIRTPVACFQLSGAGRSPKDASRRGRGSRRGWSPLKTRRRGAAARRRGDRLKTRRGAAARRRGSVLVLKRRPRRETFRPRAALSQVARTPRPVAVERRTARIRQARAAVGGDHDGDGRPCHRGGARAARRDADEHPEGGRQRPPVA